MNISRRTTIDRRDQHLKATGILRQDDKKNVTPLLKSNLNRVSSLRILGSAALRPKVLRVSSLMVDHQASGEQHHARLGEYAAQLYKDKSMTDVMVVVQSKEFKAHKAVLACYSPYFNEVLNTPGFNYVHYLQIPSVSAKAFEILLDYMYTGELKVTCQELCEVYRAAKRLGVQGALSKSMELLQVSNENFQNMVYLYVMSKKLNILDACARGFKLMVLNFEKLITTREFLDLEVDQLIELFTTDEIGARSEVIVFMAALKWLDYDFFTREEYVEKVFECVRFPLMTMPEILACYHPPLLPGLMTKPNIRQILLNATCYIAAKSLGQEALFTELAAKSRTFLFAGEPMVLWDINVFDPEKYEETKRHNAATKIQALYRGYRTRKSLFKEIDLLNESATKIQAAWSGYRVRKSLGITKRAMQKKGRSPMNYLLHMDRRTGMLKAYAKKTFEKFEPDLDPEKNAIVYAMGAFDAEKEEPNALLVFDTAKRSWTFLTRCLVPRHDSRMVYMDGFLYIIGGFNPLHRNQTGVFLPLTVCNRYHVKSNEWREMPEMNSARCSHATVVLNDEILAIGGKNEDKKVLSAIERYDMTVGKWKEFKPSLPEPRMALGCTIHKGMLWIAGGISTNGKSMYILDSVWCLDNKTCRWTKKTNLPQAIAFPSLVSDGNHLFCIGGATRPLSDDKEGLESIDKVYVYEKERWIEQATLPFQYHNIVGCNVGKKLYLFGGFSSHTMAQIRDQIFIDLDKDQSENLDTLPEEAAGFIVEATVSWQ